MGVNESEWGCPVSRRFCETRESMRLAPGHTALPALASDLCL